MRPLWLVPFVPLAGTLFAALAACDANPLPGTQLGTFEVVAQSQTNSCGLNAPNPWTFDVQLSEQGTTLYWSWMDGTPPLSAPMNGATMQTASLVATEQVNVDGTADGGLGPCTMQRADQLDVTLGSGSPPSSFSVTIQYAFSVAEGANCSDQLASGGGQYAELPCTVAYTATASKM